VYLGHNRIVVGMRTGTIQEITIKMEDKNVQPGGEMKDTKIWIKNADD
jgi:hypothetical protein